MKYLNLLPIVFCLVSTGFSTQDIAHKTHKIKTEAGLIRQAAREGKYKTQELPGISPSLGKILVYYKGNEPVYFFCNLYGDKTITRSTEVFLQKGLPGYILENNYETIRVMKNEQVGEKTRKRCVLKSKLSNTEEFYFVQGSMFYWQDTQEKNTSERTEAFIEKEANWISHVDSTLAEFKKYGTKH